MEFNCLHGNRYSSNTHLLFDKALSGSRYLYSLGYLVSAIHTWIHVNAQLSVNYYSNEKGSLLQTITILVLISVSPPIHVRVL
jgi:hypothetical protein